MSMDVETLRKLAASLILQASGELPDYPEGAAPAPAPAPAPATSRKRSAPAPTEAGSTKKSSRKSLGVINGSTETPLVNGSAKKQSRRSIAAIPGSEARTPARRSRKADLSSVSEVSQSVTNCLGPSNDLAESLAAVSEEEEADGSLVNPTPVMKELMKKRKSVAP